MRDRLPLLLALLAAVVGLVLLVVLSEREPPEIEYEPTIAPPLSVPAPVAAEPEAKPEGGTLRGKVVDGLTQEPIEGARVEALHRYERYKEGEELPIWGALKEYAHVVTGPDGTFALSELPKDYWNLWVERRGYAWTTVPRAKFDQTHTIELFPECSVHGRVIYPDGSPAPGVRIEYTPQGTHSEVFGRYAAKGLERYYTETRADGTFEYRGLPPTKFTIEVYPQDHLPAPWTHEPALKPGENRDLGTHKLDEGFSMKVNVRWRGTDEGVPGVEVVARPVGDPMPRTRIGQRRRTDANGVARFQGLGGQVMEKPRFMVTANVNDTPVMPDEPGLLEPGRDVTIWLRKDGIVRGQVVDAGGEPADHFFVQLRALGHLTRQLRVVGAEGAFEIYNVPEGRYDLHIRHRELVDAVEPIEVVGGEELDVGTIELRRGAEIYGTVRRSSGDPLEGVVMVRLGRRARIASGHDTWEIVAQTAALTDGTYRLPGIPPGEYHLWPESLQDPSSVTDPLPVTVAPGTGGLQRELVIHGDGFVKFKFMDLVDGQLREVLPVPTFLVEKATGKEMRWFAEGSRFRTGTYEVFVELENEEGVPQRYSAGTVRIQEGETAGPIELALHEIRSDG